MKFFKNIYMYNVDIFRNFPSIQVGKSPKNMYSVKILENYCFGIWIKKLAARGVEPASSKRETAMDTIRPSCLVRWSSQFLYKIFQHYCKSKYKARYIWIEAEYITIGAKRRVSIHIDTTWIIDTIIYYRYRYYTIHPDRNPIQELMSQELLGVAPN